MESAGIILLAIAVFVGGLWLGKKVEEKETERYKAKKEAAEVEWREKRRERGEEENRREEQARKKGVMGERTLLHLLRAELGDEWKLMHDIRMVDEEGNPAQIDMLVVSQNGIFVIEAKNMHCFVMGEARDEKWTMLYRGGRKEQIENPIAQNKRHIDRMASCLGEEIRGYLHNIVAFADEARFGKTMPRNVMNMSVVPYYIRDIAAREGAKLREDEVQMVVACVQEWDRHARAARKSRRKSFG